MDRNSKEYKQHIKNLRSQYRKERKQGESYGDWWDRTHSLVQQSIEMSVNNGATLVTDTKVIDRIS